MSLPEKLRIEHRDFYLTTAPDGTPHYLPVSCGHCAKYSECAELKDAAFTDISHGCKNFEGMN